MQDKNNILNYSYEQLEDAVKELGEKAFRAKQLYEWMHQKLVTDFSDMTNLPKGLQGRLAEEFYVSALQMKKCQESQIDGTRKYLWELVDKNTVESVWMQYKHGNSVCISSQVGCRMGCRFCASTVGGLVRNLTPAEMLAQVYEIQRITGERVSNIIVMGMGEPFDNYDNLIQFIHRITEERGLHISARSLTVSTCGIVPKIYEFADENLAVTLAVSLHAADDATRKKMMPVAERYTVEEIVEACRYFVEKTGRRVTFEYSMAEGVNDTKEHALALCRRLLGLNCHVNLIPLNPVDGRMGSRSRRTNIENFKSTLERNRINVTIRREMGGDIDAACGQLRKHFDTSGPFAL